MGHEIRKYMGDVDGDSGLSGHVEIDETYVGGKDDKPGLPGTNSNKIGVLGMVDRGGDVMTHIVPDALRTTLMPVMSKYIGKGSRISTDQLHAYKVLPGIGYDHHTVNHSKDEWVRGSTHTNTIEGLWARLKLSIRGTHVHVSRKHLSKYLGEFACRFNMRSNPEAMFSRLLLSF